MADAMKPAHVKMHHFDEPAEGLRQSEPGWLARSLAASPQAPAREGVTVIARQKEAYAICIAQIEGFETMTGARKSDVHRAVVAALTTREEAPARPHCQKCGGEVQGWICQKCRTAFRENDDGLLVFDREAPAERVMNRAGLTDALTVGHPDAFLNALLDYTAGFYGAAREAGMPATSVADAMNHVERAARGLHGLAIRKLEAPAEGAGEWINGTAENPVGTPVWCAWATHEIMNLRARTSEPKARGAVTAEEHHRRGVNLIGMTEWAGAHLCRAERAEARLSEVMVAVRSAHDDLIELNISNYTHEDVSEANNATVEAILTLKNVLEPESRPDPARADKLRMALEALTEIADNPTGGVGCNPKSFVHIAKRALAALNEGGKG